MTAQTSSGRLSRRSLLTSGLAGGLLLAFHLPMRAGKEAVHIQPDNVVGKCAPNAFIRFDHLGKTSLVMPQVEMGQGVYTSIPLILVEELDIDVHLVKSREPPGGIGETSVTARPRALRNASFAATGVVLRRLRIDRSLIAEKRS